MASVCISAVERAHVGKIIDRDQAGRSRVPGIGVIPGAAAVTIAAVEQADVDHIVDGDQAADGNVRAADVEPGIATVTTIERTHID